MNEKHLTGTVPANKEHLTGIVPVNKEPLTGTLSNVRRCWLAMPLGAGFLRWVLACRTIEKKRKSRIFFTSGTFFTLIPSQAAIAH